MPTGSLSVSNLTDLQLVHDSRAACAYFSVARRSASWISTRSVEPHCGFAASSNLRPFKVIRMSLLPTCPSCGQSVLDDDAVNCPFCDASMKGKPGAKPAPQAAKPGASGAPAKKAASDKNNAGDENPFGTDSPTTSRRAIQLLAKPGKGKLHRFVCPMCEGPGFWEKSAAGKYVRCPNAACPMPYFTAPALEGESTEEVVAKPAAASSSEPPKKRSPLIPLCIGVAILGGGIFLAVSMMSESAKKEQQRLNQAGVAPAARPTTTVADPDPAEAPPTKPVENGTKTVAVSSVAEIRAEGIKKIEEFALEPDRNTRKPFCRRLTAETFAMLGELNRVPEQLDQLTLVGGAELNFHRILPLTAVAWKQFEGANAAGAKKTIDDAMALASQLPPRGSLPLETAIELTTLLLNSDRNEEALALLKTIENEPAIEAQVESLLRAERLHRFDLDQAVSLRAVSASATPRVAVTVSLVYRGQAAKALAWAKSAPDAQAVIDCVAAWAEATAALGGPLDAVDAETASLTTAGKTRVFARLAIALHAAGQAEPAREALAKAVAAAGRIAVPQVPTVPDMLGLYNLPLADLTARQDEALSCGELAHAQIVLGDANAGWLTLVKASDLARATAPSPSVADQPKAAITQAGNAAIQAQLKTLLKLKTPDETRLAFNQYRKNCNALSDAAAARMSIQTNLLELGCSWGLVDRVWAELQTRAANTDAATAEPWFDTTMPSMIEAYYKTGGQAEKAADVEKVVTADKLKEKPAQRIRFWLGAKIAAETSPAQAAATLKAFSSVGKQAGDKPWQEESLFRIASGYVAQGRTKDAFTFVAAIDDAFVRETAYELIAAQATRKGDLKIVRDYATNNAIIPPERVALLRGLLVNLPKE